MTTDYLSPQRAAAVALPDDYHLHTPLCRHAEGEPAAYHAVAQRVGLAEICFTDHAPAPCGYDERCRMQLDQFAEYNAMIRPLMAQNVKPRTLFGIEADYYEGCESFLERWLNEQPFDLVLGSIHYIGGWGFDNPDNRAVWDRTDIRRAWQDYFVLVAKLADTRLFDVLTHPDLPKKFGHRIDEKQLREWAAPALDRVAAAGMAIEINTAGLRKPVGEMYPAPAILELAHERSIPITFGSDAHAPGDVGAGFAAATAMALAVGYSERARFRSRQRSLVPLEHQQPIATANRIR